MNDSQPSEYLQLLRHSLAHVLAQVVREMRPGTKLGFGPATEDGFHYDFALPAPLTLEDFPEIERRMRDILDSGQHFIREELSASDALARLDQLQEPYKREYAAELLATGQLAGLTFYHSGDFVDMCDGLHVATTSEIPRDCFKLRGLAGAYWRADASNVMMTRVQVWAFGSSAELEAYERDFAHAALRDFTARQE